ncbi:hypothetical protein RM844_27500 [Streptomyces sp. DSM 44915]|uniref:HNH endonuclease n=1 Tax=Streptomyces chisholmiae TaxID=3075540 RepID=A0ABU2JYE8_9ACTN|nr:hypothetical protein [Streptomyces sp. DSM 44915]MDT0270031.1 hypothetical protein [Streptomyces sp. DSM 44915]
MSEPIVFADLWARVMRAAGFRCQCRGECGNPHKKGAGRCPKEHDKYASKHRGPVRLIAAPIDPSAPALDAARLPHAELWAWCPECHDGARRAANRQAREEECDGQAELFEV